MKRKIHPSFVVAGAIFVVLLCAAAVRATPSILIVPLEREFGWSRALLSSGAAAGMASGPCTVTVHWSGYTAVFRIH